MTSKEKLRYLTNLIFIKSEETDIDLTQEESDNVVNFNKDLRKDLNRLEKYDEMFNQKMPEKEIFKDRDALSALDSLHRLALKRINSEYYWLPRKLREIIQKDLDRLEKQDKAIEIIKTKQVDINEFIKYINSPLFNDTNIKAIDYYNLLHMNGLSQEEWDLLKEVFG